MGADTDFDFTTEDPASFLDELEAGLEDPGITPIPVTPPLTREQVDELVDRTLEEELARLKDRTGRGVPGRP